MLKFRGHVDSFHGSILRGWCAGEDRSPGMISVTINGDLIGHFASNRPRKDLVEQGICSEGGGFSVDLSSFLRAGENSIMVSSLDGKQLSRGVFQIKQEVETSGTLRPFLQSRRGKIGLLGKFDIASDPASGAVLSKLLDVLPMDISDGKDGDEDCSIWWDNPERLSGNDGKLINGRFRSNKKTFIDEAHYQTFGRSVCVTKEGVIPSELYAIKSDVNAAHDGKVMLGRDVLSKGVQGSVIQRLIDNRIDDDHIYDIRIPVIGNEIPLIYIKIRPVKTRFTNTNTSVSVTMPGNIISPDEMRDIFHFTRLLNLDYGEIDVLRDGRSNDIWIVDVNNTPSGPPNGISIGERNFAVREMAMAFYRQFVKPSLYAI